MTRAKPTRAARPFIEDISRIASRRPKRQYWTEGRLKKLLPGLIVRRRQQWFADRVRELKSLPHRTREEILTAASRIRPRRLMPRWVGGRWQDRWEWPKGEFEMHEALHGPPPHDIVDTSKLRHLLTQMDSRQGERLIALMLESGLDVFPGDPRYRDMVRNAKTLLRIRRADALLRAGLGRDPDGDIATAMRPGLPLARTLGVIRDVENDPH